MPAGGRSPFFGSTEKGRGLVKCASPPTVQIESGRKRESLLSSPPASDDLPGNVVSYLTRWWREVFLSPVGINAGRGEKTSERSRNIKYPPRRVAGISSFRGRLLKESNSNQYGRDKGRVVLADSAVTLLSLGKLRLLTPDACSPKPQRVGSFQVGRAPGIRLWSQRKSPPLFGKSPNLDFSHLKNGDKDTYLETECYDNVHESAHLQSLTQGTCW